METEVLWYGVLSLPTYLFHINIIAVQLLQYRIRSYHDIFVILFSQIMIFAIIISFYNNGIEQFLHGLHSRHDRFVLSVMLCYKKTKTNKQTTPDKSRL